MTSLHITLDQFFGEQTGYIAVGTDVRGSGTAAAVPCKYLLLLLRHLYDEINMKALDKDHIRPPVRPSIT